VIAYYHPLSQLLISDVPFSCSDYAEHVLPIAPLLGPSGRGWNAGGMHHLDALPLGNGDWLAAVDGWHTGPDWVVEQIGG
jgi:hypothetical protein